MSKFLLLRPPAPPPPPPLARKLSSSSLFVSPSRISSSLLHPPSPPLPTLLSVSTFSFLLLRPSYFPSSSAAARNPGFRPIVRSLESSASKTDDEEPRNEDLAVDGRPSTDGSASSSGSSGDLGISKYPTDEFEMEKFNWWRTFLVKVRMFFAFPWERVKKGSVLHMKLRGTITDQLKSRFSSGLSLPQICENFVKAAYDSRISGIYLEIEPLSCGWGKVDEIRRHIMNFRKSGKFIVSYIPICGEKEYYLACACEEVYVPPSAYVAIYGLTVQSSFLRGLLDKVGIEPQVERIGRYKSAGDQLARKYMSKEVREMLTTLLDDIYGNWLETIAETRGKMKEEIEGFLDSGVYQVQRLKEEGWITNILYDDEVQISDPAVA